MESIFRLYDEIPREELVFVKMLDRVEISRSYTTLHLSVLPNYVNLNDI